jgi:osmotically-inducible protein OsmY
MAKAVGLLLAGTLFCTVALIVHTNNANPALSLHLHANAQNDQNSSDREIARTIRRDIVRYKALSTYAHNIKIHVKDGRVTLLGLVRSEIEAKNLKAKAVAAAGENRVINQLDVVNWREEKGEEICYCSSFF